MKINWKIRLKNKTTLVALASATATFAGSIAVAFGYTGDTSTWVTVATTGAGAIFYVLSMLGVVVDPSTKGVSDSTRVLSRAELGDNASTELLKGDGK